MVENRVRERRLELGMTLEQISRESGVPVSTISDIEHGAEPGVLTALAIARALMKPVEGLWLD